LYVGVTHNKLTENRVAHCLLKASQLLSQSPQGIAGLIQVQDDGNGCHTARYTKPLLVACVADQQAEAQQCVRNLALEPDYCFPECFNDVGRCSCPQGMNRFFCKHHALALMVRFKVHPQTDEWNQFTKLVIMYLGTYFGANQYCHAAKGGLKPLICALASELESQQKPEGQAQPVALQNVPSADLTLQDDVQPLTPPTTPRGPKEPDVTAPLTSPSTKFVNTKGEAFKQVIEEAITCACDLSTSKAAKRLMSSAFQRFNGEVTVQLWVVLLQLIFLFYTTIIVP
jgi:hypothetical protein